MKTGSLVTFKCFKNIEKIKDIGVILEIEDRLILKESIGFGYEQLLRIHWFTENCLDGIPSFNTDYLNRRWYRCQGIYTLQKEK